MTLYLAILKKCRPEVDENVRNEHDINDHVDDDDRIEVKRVGVAQASSGVEVQFGL